VTWAGKSERLQKLELPAGHPGPGDHLGLPDAFNATSDALIESWRVAQVVDYGTGPGDTVVITDRQGISGVLALEQAMRPADQRRRVVVLAGEATYLRFRSHAGTAYGLPPSEQSEVDWEIAAYEWADKVVTPSAWVVDELSEIGVDAELIDAGSGDTQAIPSSVQRVWLPEAVVRSSRIGTLLRALNTWGQSDLTVTMSPEDGEDEVWTGSTWDALDGVRLIHHANLERMPEPDEPDLIILGDRTAVPHESGQRMVGAGVAVLVPHGSTAAGLWPTAPTWRDGPDLVACLRGEGANLAGSGRGSSAVTRTLEIPRRPTPAERAKKISIGIPVFRDVRFLEECVDSLLAQTEAPFEILIYDDGSNLDSVDLALRELSGRDGRIKILSGPNQGVCIARNQMLEVMGGDAFVFVDADDVLEPTFLRQTADALRANPDLSAVATWTRFFGTYEAVEAKPPFDRRTGLHENPIISTCALVDMEMREKGVRFAPDLAWLFCEDWHFWTQIVAKGGHFGLIPEPLAKHRVHSSGGHRRTELAYNLGRARATELLT
jgi:hypothetical protein